LPRSKNWGEMRRARFTARAWIETLITSSHATQTCGRARFTARAWIETAKALVRPSGVHGRARFTARAWIETAVPTGVAADGESRALHGARVD